MLRVLIVSPHFPPTNAADSQRVRMVLPYFRENEIDAVVLSVEAGQTAAPQDAWLEEGLPPDVPVTRVKGLPLSWGRVPGLGTLTFRALGALRRKGDSLLRSGDFDLVYFSTTQFGIHALGPRWKTRFGVPFVLDYQDPWVSNYYKEHPQVAPPGGRLKYFISTLLSRFQEPRVLRQCAGITSVSTAYPKQLKERYGWLEIWHPFEVSAPLQARLEEKSKLPRNGTSITRLPALVIPFPGDERDLVRVVESSITQSVFNPCDGNEHWVYVGRGGNDMAQAVNGIFAAVAMLLSGDAARRSRLRLHFIGTSYAAAGHGKKSIEPLAAAHGLEGIVEEHPGRIPYSETLRCLMDADALMVPGSDDPAYTASKIYPYLLAGKPLLAVFHEKSSVVELIRKVGGGNAVSFTTGQDSQGLGRQILEHAFLPGTTMRQVTLDKAAFAPFAASAQAKSLARFFRQCLAETLSSPASP